MTSQFKDQLPASASEVVEKSKSDVRSELLKNQENINRPDPFVAGDFLSAIPIATGNRIFDFYIQLAEGFRLNMPHSAEGQSLEDWGNIYIGAHLPEKPAEGNIVITGENNAIVPTTRKYNASNGFEYEIVTSSKVTTNTLTVSSYSLSGTTLEIVFNEEHFISANCDVTISGATPSDFNKTYENPFVKDANTIQVVAPVETTPTGTLEASFLAGKIYVRALLDENLNGSDSNSNSNESFEIDIPVSGIDDTALVSGGGLKGGYDYESSVDYQLRYLDKIRNPVAHFNDSDIKQQVQKSLRDFKMKVIKPGDKTGIFNIDSISTNGKFATATTLTAHGLFTGAKITITGATESEFNVVSSDCLYIDDFNFAYVVDESAPASASGTIECTSVMPLGRTDVYLYGSKTQKILDSTDLNLAKKQVEKIIPGNTPFNFVNIKSPAINYIDFNFETISPDNSEMRKSIEESIKSYFDDNADVNLGLDQDAYKAAISLTVTSSGEKLSSFVLNSPTSDIDTVYGAIPILRQVNFDVS